ncbi:hypothetical protein D0962_23050 [Leptolyngbyaceae cyanobacterium CCMR0082]|uniref:Uncharacterized protein n=1 Tax=Adonisia turfae CCMR0082 TaxID=2304604 RepID=A0A6M0SAR9_9CYAN|nr:hypothetical protein [Adonisia turfae]NEZ65598.1 hypothetical protein [Adonisia turfae CCMR0082]
MADPLASFRTVTDLFLVKYDLVGGILTPTPIGIPSAPSSAVLAPGFTTEDLTQTSCQGPTEVILTYLASTIPELTIGFSSVGPELEAALLNRKAEAVTNEEGWVYFSAVADDTTVAARVDGDFGFSVTAQDANSEALVYYFNPDTKLSVPLTIAAGAPAGQDEIQIGAALELTLHADLAATGYQIYGWVPAVVFPNKTKINNRSPLLYGAYMMGVCFDGTVRQLTARRLGWFPGGDFTKEPSREIKFRVLADSNSSTGYGYSIEYIPEAATC